MQKPVDIIRVGNTLGEGVLWDCERRRVWWTDIQEKKLFRYDPQAGGLEKFDLPERLGSFGLVEGGTQIVARVRNRFCVLSARDRRARLDRAPTARRKGHPLQ